MNRQIDLEMMNDADKRCMKANFAAMVRQMQDAQKQHAAGTVSEIAARFGISKSEVRRLKADGKLDAFIAEKTA